MALRESLHLYEYLLAKTAQRAGPIVWKFLKWGACCDTILWIALLGVIDVVTGGTNILFHIQLTVYVIIATILLIS